MDKISYVRVKMEHQGTPFMGVPIYNNGDTFIGIMDKATQNVMVNVKGVMIILEMNEGNKHFVYEFIEEPKEVEKGTLDIIRYCKMLELMDWIEGKEISIIKFKPLISGMYWNDVDGLKGGAEFLSSEQYYLTIIKDDKYITQIRKGSIFYLNSDIRGEEVTIDELSYDELKEVKFLYENDFKKTKDIEPV